LNEKPRPLSGSRPGPELMRASSRLTPTPAVTTMRTCQVNLRDTPPLAKLRQRVPCSVRYCTRGVSRTFPKLDRSQRGTSHRLPRRIVVRGLTDKPLCTTLLGELARSRRTGPRC
jgi:hypothetical protein